MSLTSSPLFSGLDQAALNDALTQMRPHYYGTDEYLFREGEVGDRMCLIESGYVEVIVGDGDQSKLVNLLRRGDIVGEMALITEEPRAASILAGMPTLVLELDQCAFADLVGKHPKILMNITRMLIDRYKRSTTRLMSSPHKSELQALLIGRGSEKRAEQLVLATQGACPQKVMVVDLCNILQVEKVHLSDVSAASALTTLDMLRSNPGIILAVAYSDQTDVGSLVRFVDRLFVLGNEADIYACAPSIAAMKQQVDVFLLGDKEPDAMGSLSKMRIARRFRDDDGKTDATWAGRHMARAKIGIALGAGGAKGFAHVGVLSVLAKAGYQVDYIAGSSIGAIVGVLMGLGLTAEEIETELKDIWSPERVRQLASLTYDGVSVGLEQVLRRIKDTVGERKLTDLQIPLMIMTADLQQGEPVPIRDWPIYEALCAGIAIPGLCRPYQRGPQRLVDGICLTPVPVVGARDMGADIVIAVNLLNRNRIAALPSDAPPLPRGEGYREGANGRNIDPLVETLMMLQVDRSIRHAATADIVMTPRFPPTSWRDFHLADLFREAGREAAEAELWRLSDKALPAD